MVPRVTSLPIPRTPPVETGEVEALERLDQAIEKYLVHWQRSLVTDEARPSDLFPAFQRYATDLLDAYASECIRLGKGPDFDTCLTDLTGYILTRILPDLAKKPPAAGPTYTVVIPWTGTSPDDFADKDGDWETELVLCLQLPSVHLFEDSGLWNPWDLVRALREPPARHRFEQEIGIALTRRLRDLGAQARQRRTKAANDNQSSPVATFTTPEGVTWKDVRIRFTSDERVQIAVGDRTEVRNFAEMGLEDSRGRASKPNLAWQLLREMAAAGKDSVSKPAGLDDLTTRKQWVGIEKRVQEIRKQLRRIFPSISGNPIEFDKQTKTYKPNFRLSFPDSDRL